jgi:predicted nicotinamide N-methyase
VLDLGAGSGLVAIAAALAGASHVIAADIDRYSIIATGLNAAANNVTLSAIHADLMMGPPPEGDTLLVADLFYDAALAQRVTAFLDRCLTANRQILVGDPWRAHLPHDRLQLVAEYPGHDFGNSGAEPKTNAVFRFR